MPRALPEVSATQIAGVVASALTNMASLSDIDFRDPGIQATVRSSFAAAAGAAWADVERGIRLHLDSVPWFVVVRGLPADESGRLIVALSAALGEALEPLGEPWASVVRRVEGTPSSGLRLDELPHTDSTDWPEPNAWTVLQCIRPDPRGGGRSRVIEGTSLVGEILKQRGAQALKLVRAIPMPWAIADALGGGTHHEPVLGTRIRWMPYTVHSACERDCTILQPSAAKVLEIVADAVRAAQARAIWLGIGDVLIVDNRRTLHGRTPVEGGGRILLRTKVGPAWR
jgi:hypothetical protein